MRDKKNKKVTKDLEYAEQNEALPKAIICDLDGTLALICGRSPYDATHCYNDTLNRPVANLLKNYKKLGFTILLLSGREEKFRAPTLQFLTSHEIVFDKLLMRRTSDNRKDNIIKRELFDRDIKDRYFIEFVLDDRDQVVEMWRHDLQLPCFQVYYGNF